MPPSLKNGVAILTTKLANIPETPGVYRMINDTGKVIYVGKAKNLRKRLTNYTNPARLEYRIQGMVANIAELEIITTSSEIEALLLEANLIKKYEPKYNILLKDDKSYPYIVISIDHDFPRILKHRGAKTIPGKYYGPFPSASAVNATIADLQKAFLIRPCSDSFFSKRTRPCMEYQIKRCSAPCTGKIDKVNYAQLVTQTTEFLGGKSREIQQELACQMQQSSKQMHYEQAASLRDRIKALNHIQEKQSVYMESVANADIIGIHIESGQCCIQVFFFRQGRNLGNAPFYPTNTENATEAEILAAFILQFYANNTPPAELILSHMPPEKNLLSQAISTLTNTSIKITIPKTGNKKTLITQAIKNAQTSLRQKMLGQIKQQTLLQELGKLFALPEPPKRIEIYDNSHIMGKYEVGAMVVATPDGFDKKSYRRFNIKGDDAGKGDDFAMLKQVLTRRFKAISAKESNDITTETLPDLMLIDGGAGHMNITKQVLTEYGLDNIVKFACIAKGPDRNAGREYFFIPGQEPFQLQFDSPLLYYLQILRDEAHRFAIGSHRIKRSKSVTKSILDEIPNIGTKRKKSLLNHFGSAASIKNATLHDLLQVEGINQKIAATIYSHFNPLMTR